MCLLKISCDYDKRVGVLEVLEADRPIMVGELAVRTTAPLTDGDTIRIDVGQFLRCDFSERIIEEERNIIRSLEVVDVNHRFGNSRHRARGHQLSPSTAAKWSASWARAARAKARSCASSAASCSRPAARSCSTASRFIDNLEALKRYVSYIPQDDAFDEHLTIGENLQFAAAIRSPHLSRRDRTRRLEGKLIELGLSERRDSIVGSPVKKTLSGGERKRLNIGLDMIGSADVYLFDEPTSGLSSKDSEHVIEIIRGMAHNKIIVVTIHQPSSKIFQMFHKAILLDKGGRLVFFGTPTDMLRYFAEAEHQHQFGADLGACAACGTTRPEFIFDVLETPLRDLSGDIIYEENNRGQLMPARRYSPEFWRDKYEAFRLIQDVKQVPLRREPAPPLPPEPPRRVREPIRWHDEWTQLRTLLRRAFTSKLRNRANLVITIGVAPLLAILIATILRYSDSGSYDFASAYHIPTYLFLTLIVAMFLGLTNSADDIIRDRAVLQRERNLNVRLSYYVFAKTSLVRRVRPRAVHPLRPDRQLPARDPRHVLALPRDRLHDRDERGVVRPGHLLARGRPENGRQHRPARPHSADHHGRRDDQVRGHEPEPRAGLHLLPLVFTNTRTATRPQKMDSRLQVPFICEFVAMRWSYEELVVAQAKLNPLTETPGGSAEADRRHRRAA